MKAERWRLGVELGGTKIEVLALDRKGPKACVAGCLRYRAITKKAA